MMSRYQKLVIMSKEWVFNRKFLSNCCISSGMLVIGDVLQQSYEIFVKRQSDFHMRRIFKMGYAGFGTGAFAHHLYAILDRRIPGRDMKSLTKKVLLDNLSAPFSFFLFFAIIALAERKRLEEFLNEFTHKGTHLYLASTFVYAPAQYFNFYFLTPPYRVCFVSTLNLLFDTYSSYIAHNDRHEAFESPLPDNCHL